MGAKMGFGWYLVQAIGGSEHKAADALMGEGLNVWVPEYRAAAVHARQMTIRTRALFPGYLFAWCDPELGHFAAAKKSWGARFVMFGERASPVPERIMEGLTYACAKGLFDSLPQGSKPTPKSFPQGAKVVVRDARFGEIIGKIKAQPHGQRAQIFIEWLGREMVASVPLDRIELVSQL